MSELLTGTALTAAIADLLYDRAGRPVPGAGVFRMELLPAYAVAPELLTECRGEAQATLDAAEPFLDWWDRHPELAARRTGS